MFRCLDSILHAEHKSILEKMRMYYSLSHSRESITDHSVRLEEALSPEKSLAKIFASDGSTDTVNKEEICRRKEEDDKPSYFYGNLDVRKLLRSFTSTSSSSVVESRLVMFV